MDVKPESPWPEEEDLRRMVAPYELRERLPIYPRYIENGWYSEELKTLIKRYADKDGFRQKEGF